MHNTHTHTYMYINTCIALATQRNCAAATLLTDDSNSTHAGGAHKPTSPAAVDTYASAERECKSGILLLLYPLANRRIN